MSKDSLKRLKEAASFFRDINQTEIADQLDNCVADIQSLHHELQQQTQALLQGTAPALSKNVESTLQSCETKLDEMTNTFETSTQRSMTSALTQMDQKLEARVSETRLGEKLVQTIKQELPQDLKTPARHFLMEEAGPVWTQRWAVAMLGMTVSMLMILGLMLTSAQRTKNQIVREATTLSMVQAKTIEATEVLARMEAQTMGIQFFRMESGMAMRIPDNLRMRRPPANVRGALNDPERQGLYWIEER